MISIIESGALLNPDMTPMNSASATLVGLSTDSKPTGANGWIFSEIDTGKIYIYDAENSQWREWSGGGSGGGGGSSSMESLKITFTNGTADTTWQQAYDALAAGKFVYTLEVTEGDALMIQWYQAAIDNGTHVVLGTKESFALAEAANGYLFYD